MDGLAQGVLANNSVTPDVEIQKFDQESARNHLKNAMHKASVCNRICKGTQQKVKSFENVQPCLIEKQRTDNHLAFEVAKLANKLEDFERNAKMLEQNQKDERTLEIEKKLNKITDERLQYLEKLQHEQEQWKSQYFQTIKKLNSMQPVSEAYSKPSYPNVYPISDSKHNILETPLPRKTVPQPTSSIQVGNGQFLRDILDQSAIASTPNNASHQRNIGPIDTIPVRLNDGQPMWNPEAHQSSSIKPSTSQLITKEIENEAERKQISEKFPNSITEYLPNANASPVTHVLSKSIPPSSLVADFRSKLRKLIEMRSNLENNLQAVQRKPKLTDYATAALVKQLEEEGLLSAGDEKLLWIEKLVDEEINLHMAQVKEEVSEELSKQKRKPSKIERHSRFSRTNKMKKPEKTVAEPKKPKKAKPPQYPGTDNGDESFITRVYGKADYHPHRTTVHDPFMHIASPLKSPKYRTKRALQSVPATYVRSEKTQTKVKPESPTLLKSKYLAPTAISLRPPQIYENDPDPVLIPAAQPPKKSPLVKRVEIVREPDSLPGNDTFCSCESSDTPVEENEVEVDGEGCRRKLFPRSCTPLCKPKSPPICRRSPLPTDDEICPLEKMKCWVEQEVMSRILNQLYPPSAKQVTETLNLETDTMKKLVEDEIQAQIRQRLLRRDRTKPKEPKPETPCPVHTPIPTPQSTPCQSVSEESVSHYSVKTPALSTETSIAETEEPEVSVHVPSPEVSTSHEIVEVITPQETPVPSPEVSVKEERVKSPELSFVDPWEGKMPDDDLINRLSSKVAPNLAPEPEPIDLVVRSITPPVKPQRSLSTSSESSSSSLVTEDKTISEGQLVIEHGEMRLKKRKPLQVPENYEELMNQNTLHDVVDIEPISEGEFRPRFRPPIVQTRYADIVTDDPSGIYIRPRKPGVPSDTEDLSVGEVPDRKRTRFDRWRASRQSASPPQPKPNEETPLSVGDLDSTNVSSSISEELAPNVIMVTSATSQGLKRFGEPSEPGEIPELAKSDQIIRDSLDDPVVKPRNQMTFMLPTTDPLSGASDVEEISIHDF